MNQPRTKNLYPTINNITDEQVPIPIETVYFLEDGERDPVKPNRFYFNFPPEWSTSNVGESIVGVRNIYMLSRRRKLEFDLSIRKYLRIPFDELKAKEKNKNRAIDELYDMLDEKYKAKISVHVISWLSTDNDLRKLFDDIIKILKPKFDEFNAYQKEKYKIEKDIQWWKGIAKYLIGIATLGVGLFAPVSFPVFNGLIFTSLAELVNTKIQINKWYKDNVDELIPMFRLDEVSRELNDIQMDGYYSYNKSTFIETIFSPLNTKIEAYIKDQDNKYTKVEDINLSPYYVEFKINFLERSTDSNYRRYDFVDVMNIGDEPFQNKKDQFQNVWLERIDFKNVWDRHACKVCSSIAEQSLHNYVGSSSIFFNPIKYYKLNSTDQRFWIELYSGRHNNIPVVIPNNESFSIEMQFLQYNKLLYT